MHPFIFVSKTFYWNKVRPLHNPCFHHCSVYTNSNRVLSASLHLFPKLIYEMGTILIPSLQVRKVQRLSNSY
jgi:hypothetical protein